MRPPTIWPMEGPEEVIRYWLNRKEDVSGTSGVGKVAEVILLTNGQVVVGWFGDHPSVEIHPTLESVLAIHGHGGKTVLEIVC